MKKSITGVVALLAGAFVAHSQGTVEFGNYVTTTPYTYVSLLNNGTSTKLGGAAASTGNFANDTGSGADWTVALYGAASGSTPAQLDDAGGTPVTATLELGDGTDGAAGTWYSTAVGVVPNTPNGAGSALTLQVYAWYNAGGTINTYAAAQTAGVPTGFSTTVSGVAGGPNASGPPSTPNSYAFPNFTVSGGTVVTPEPSTIALGVMGASAFLMRLRKKQ